MWKAGLKGSAMTWPWAKIPERAIKVTTILGSRYLAFEPQGPGSLPDATFDLEQTEVPYDLQEALTDVTTTYEQVDTDKFAKTLGILGEQVAGACLRWCRRRWRTPTPCRAILADRREQLGALLKTTEMVSNTLRRQQSNIASLIPQGNDLIGEFVTRGNLPRHDEALTNLVQTLSDIVIDDRPELKGCSSLRELSDMLAQHDDLLRSTLQSGPVALRGWPTHRHRKRGRLQRRQRLLVDSWMCAISGRAKQFGMIQYFKDCK